LGKKPVSSATGDSSKKAFDPFENPAHELFVAEVPAINPTHNLVLNKYPVIFNHFILATKENKPQTSLLEEADLYLTYACLQAWQEDTEGRAGHSLFAFFNSGEHSGASQTHRHLQFLPIEDMKGDVKDDWRVLCETMRSPVHDNLALLHNPSLPFVHFATALRPSLGAADIYRTYLFLMQAALAGISEATDLETFDAVSISQDGRATFSYNLAMTAEVMAILPRRAEATGIPGVTDSSIAINGTILAGTMMVKSEEEWHRLRKQPEHVLKILSDITYSKTRNAAGV